MFDVGGKPVPVRRPLSTRDLPLLRAYVEAEVALQIAEHAHGPTGEGFDFRREKTDRDEAWARLEAGA